MWRTLIAAELVFGVSSGSGGLGWFIFERKNQLPIPEVFAGLLTVIVFGWLVKAWYFVRSRMSQSAVGAWLNHSREGLRNRNGYVPFHSSEQTQP